MRHDNVSLSCIRTSASCGSALSKAVVRQSKHFWQTCLSQRTWKGMARPRALLVRFLLQNERVNKTDAEDKHRSYHVCTQN